MSRRPAVGKRRDLLRWLGWFTVANAACAGLIGVRYLWLYDWPADALGIGYALLAFIGQSALLALVWVFLPAATAGPRLAESPRGGGAGGGRRRPRCSRYLFLDANVFAQYRYHLDVLTAALFERSTWVAVGVQFLVLLVFAGLLARGRRRAGRRGGPLGTRRTLAGRGLGRLLGRGAGDPHLGGCCGVRPGHAVHPLPPNLFPLQSRRRLAELGSDRSAAPGRARQLNDLDAAGGPLRYPLSPLSCRDGAPLNLMVILIDALRPDVIHPELTPTS